MASPQVAFNFDQMDDPILAEGTPGFDGGQVSNQRANLLAANQSSALVNCDIDRLGKIRTRRGTVRLGTTYPGDGITVQGLIHYLTKDYNYLVAAANSATKTKIYKFDDPAWTQIATGGVPDNAPLFIRRDGLINNAGGYAVGATVFTVDGFVGTVENGETFVFHYDSSQYVYTVIAHTETAGNTTQITIEAPGLVSAVFDNWPILVKKPAAVNNGGGYAAGTTTMTIDGYVGVANNGEIFVIQGENVKHTISAHSETAGNTTSITFSPGLQAAYEPGVATSRVIFAQGGDSIYWTDGVGNIYGWNGTTTLNLANGNLYDQYTAVATANGLPPTAVKSLVWFQNRLIAGGPAAEPDAVYFSDFLDATSWDRTFQQVRIGGGESDPITVLVPWTDLNMLVFKQHSIYVVNCDPSQNPDPADITSLVGSFQIKLINKNIGCLAGQTAVQVGGGSSSPGSDVFFLANDNTVRSLRRVIAAETQQEIGEPLSLPVQDILERINKAYVDRSVATYHDNRFILAFPIDSATEPNVVLVYNLLTQSWSGTWIGWSPTCFATQLQTAYFPRMVFGQWTQTGVSLGTVQAWRDDIAEIATVAADYQDNVSGGSGAAIPTRILTRAYTWQDPFNHKTGFNCEFEFDSSDANVTVSVILDGASQTYVFQFDSQSGIPLFLPFVLPAVLPAEGVLRARFDLQRFKQFRELQFLINSASEKLNMRSIRLTGFMDTMEIQGAILGTTKKADPFGSYGGSPPGAPSGSFPF